MLNMFELSPTDVVLTVIFVVVGILLGGVGGFFLNRLLVNNKLGNAKNKATIIIDEALAEAKTYKKEAILEAKEEVLRLKTDFEKESKERRLEITKQETRISQKEELLLRREEAVTRKQETVEQQHESLNAQQIEFNNKKAELDKFGSKIINELERVAMLTKEQARQQIVESITEEARKEAAIIVRDIEADARDNGEKKAREIITSVIQRCAADQVSEVTVTTVALPNDEMKGRLIGREGRNIRALENATGVDMIIDDTPEVVIVSDFDPIRRQIAKISIEKLIADGRIHPARIEEMVEKVTADMDIEIKESGESAAFDTNVFGLHPEIIKIIGRLKYRTSYGQNVLQHSIEVSYIAGMMADELGLDSSLARRAGLLHDIGKAVDHEIQGTHIQIGADLAKKYRESAEVINAIQAHHGDVEPQSLEAILVAAADAVSSARPGARRESLENYVKRLEKLEMIANGFNGVQKTYAIQAGREIRIIVKPEVVDDASSILLAKDIARKIEEDLDYPGQIKVNVIREFRSMEIAK